jgi:hypothetical protein
MKMSAKLTIAAAAVLLATTAGVPALALSRANPHANAQASEVTSTTDTAGSQAAEHKATAQAKLTEAKLRVCQNRQKAITNIMSRIADRGQKQLDLFGTIATRVETFYTDKGKTLDTYDTLVADVSAKQDAAQTTVDAVKSASTGFSCDSDDPQAFVSTFKDSLKSEISALQDYRTAVKNLTVGVKSVQGTTTSAANQSDGGNQ